VVVYPCLLIVSFNIRFISLFLPASDLSLGAKSSLASRFNPEDFAQMKVAAENLSVLTKRSELVVKKKC